MAMSIQIRIDDRWHRVSVLDGKTRTTQTLCNLSAPLAPDGDPSTGQREEPSGCETCETRHARRATEWERLRSEP